MLAGRELAQETKLSATLTREVFMKNLNPLPTSAALWAVREGPSSLAETEMRQCRLGGMCWVAAASLPDVCARLARIASRISAYCGNEVYRINGLVRVVKEWRRATMPEAALPSRPWRTLGVAARPRMACAIGARLRIAVRFLGWVVECCVWGPVGRRQVPIRLRGRLDVVDFVGPAPCFAADIQVNEEASKEQHGRRSLRTQ